MGVFANGGGGILPGYEAELQTDGKHIVIGTADGTEEKIDGRDVRVT